MKIVRIFLPRFVKAFLACAVVMTSPSNILGAFALSHLLVATKVGAITGLLAILVFTSVEVKSNRGKSVMTGVLTALADAMTHSSHFGAFWSEAVVTGLVSAGLSMLWLNRKLILNKLQ